MRAVFGRREILVHNADVAFFHMKLRRPVH
jgi:hypothetical protein